MDLDSFKKVKALAMRDQLEKEMQSPVPFDFGGVTRYYPADLTSRANLTYLLANGLSETVSIFSDPSENWDTQSRETLSVAQIQAIAATFQTRANQLYETLQNRYDAIAAATDESEVEAVTWN